MADVTADLAAVWPRVLQTTPRRERQGSSPRTRTGCSGLPAAGARRGHRAARRPQRVRQERPGGTARPADHAMSSAVSSAAPSGIAIAVASGGEPEATPAQPAPLVPDPDSPSPAAAAPRVRRGSPAGTVSGHPVTARSRRTAPPAYPDQAAARRRSRQAAARARGDRWRQQRFNELPGAQSGTTGRRPPSRATSSSPPPAPAPGSGAARSPTMPPPRTGAAAPAQRRGAAVVPGRRPRSRLRRGSAESRPRG